jgi:acetolactate synthase-1/2/3 large subunit
VNGAEVLVAALRARGVSRVFGLPGVHNLPIWSALADSEIDVVGVRHEQTAVYAADGQARATGRLGVAVVTTGPGAANTLGATGEAWASGTPVLVIATDIATGLRRPGVYRGVLHETRDQAAMFEPVTKGAISVARVERLGEGVDAAIDLALAAPSGPVYLGIPTDLLTKSASVSLQEPVAPRRVEIDAASLAAAATLLRQAQRPLIWAGGGALRADAGAPSVSWLVASPPRC